MTGTSELDIFLASTCKMQNLKSSSTQKKTKKQPPPKNPQTKKKPTKKPTKIPTKTKQTEWAFSGATAKQFGMQLVRKKDNVLFLFIF